MVNVHINSSDTPASGRLFILNVCGVGTIAVQKPLTLSHSVAPTQHALHVQQCNILHPTAKDNPRTFHMTYARVSAPLYAFLIHALCSSLLFKAYEAKFLIQIMHACCSRRLPEAAHMASWGVNASHTSRVVASCPAGEVPRGLARHAGVQSC